MTTIQLIRNHHKSLSSPSFPEVGYCAQWYLIAKCIYSPPSPFHNSLLGIPVLCLRCAAAHGKQLTSLQANSRWCPWPCWRPGKNHKSQQAAQIKNEPTTSRISTSNPTIHSPQAHSRQPPTPSHTNQPPKHKEKQNKTHLLNILIKLINSTLKIPPRLIRLLLQLGLGFFSFTLGLLAVLLQFSPGLGTRGFGFFLCLLAGAGEVVLDFVGNFGCVG